MAGQDLAIVDSLAILNPDMKTIERVKEHLQDEEMTEFDLPRVRVPTAGGTSWTIPTPFGEETEKSIEGIVLFSKHTRSWWEKTEPTGDGDPPDCSSQDAEHARARDGVNPGAEQDEHQNFLCKTCPKAEWGSSEKSERGQACKKFRAMFLATAGRTLPLVVVLPPTSLQPAKRFFLDLVNYEIDPHSVPVKLTLEKTKNPGTPEFSRVVFTATGDRLTPEQTEKVREYSQLMRPHFERYRVEDQEMAADVDGAVTPDATDG